VSRIRQVRKRDGRLVPFERAKIADAIFRAARALGGEDRFLAEELAGVVVAHLERRGPATPSIEDVQDVVERVLIETGHARTAKAFILYRERRAAARAARLGGGPSAGVLVGGEDDADARAWSKASLVEALVEVDGLERGEAEDVARAVEERVFESALPRVSGSLVIALARSELLARGRESRLGTDACVGVPREDVAAWLAGGETRRRVEDPAAFARLLGERALAVYALDEVLPAPAAEAHRLGGLHLYDLGAPLCLTAITLPLGRLLELHLDGETASRAMGPRRVASTLGEVLRRYRPFAARRLALEDLNVFLAPFLSHLDEDGLAAEVRELLLSPEVAAFPDRGGLLDLEVGLAAEVPRRLAGREVPAPAPPGRTYGDFADVAREVGRLLLREAVALRRRGWTRGPRFTLVLPREGPPDAAARALVHEALATAAEMGDPVVAFEEAGAPSRGSRWLRLREVEAPDPLRFPEGDVSAATATGLNLVAAALRAGRGGTETFRADLERLVRAALDAAVARRALLERCGEQPGLTLYPLCRGAVPLVDLDGACHLLEPVGLERAAALLEPASDARWRAGFRRRILVALQERVAGEAAARGLQAAVREGLSDEAGLRFAALDAARFGVAGAWWKEGVVPSYAAEPPPPGEWRREPSALDRLKGGRAFLRVRHRVHAGRRPPVSDLLAALEAAAHDASVVEYALEPWPHRVVRAEARPPG